MEITIGQILKMFAIVNGIMLCAILFRATMPFWLDDSIGIVVGEWRYGYGSDGWVIQHQKTYEVAAQGWFPWHKPYDPRL